MSSASAMKESRFLDSPMLGTFFTIDAISCLAVDDLHIDWTIPTCTINYERWNTADASTVVQHNGRFRNGD
ncbi:hypothetical protein ColTof4_03891 [Colletotrichum tofieldiae]|nr:hypothetical protein ColTof3_13738 [Colletotrichum tofieldiae]GKT71468.1 hypothetical protein ColTof4_03891 [Colletotrichum tofieldiae]GKT95378.1 hypothetical protein Ct61P_13228 [Colletotrichum tofieldiae]